MADIIIRVHYTYAKQLEQSLKDDKLKPFIIDDVGALIGLLDLLENYSYLIIDYSVKDYFKLIIERISKGVKVIVLCETETTSDFNFVRLSERCGQENLKGLMFIDRPPDDNKAILIIKQAIDNFSPTIK